MRTLTIRSLYRSTMLLMSWDTASASVAASYINKCPGLVHNVNRGNRGENIYVRCDESAL
jgi:hypothetical protein